MKRAVKRKHSSVASVAGPSSSVATRTQKKRRILSPFTGSTMNAKKSASFQNPSTSGECRPPSLNTSTGYECPICLESTRKNEMQSLPCYHAFHQACIDTWMIENRRCPVCRQDTASPQNAIPPVPLQNARRPASPQNSRRPASPQNSRPPASPQNARPPALPQNARPPALPQNARPPLNNQRQMISGVLQALPGMRTVRNNVSFNFGGIDMRLNNGVFMRINNDGIDMRLNNASMRINSDGIEMRLNNASMRINNSGIEMRLNNGGSMIRNNDE